MNNNTSTNNKFVVDEQLSKSEEFSNNQKSVKNVGILLAAGLGSRFNQKMHKQYIKINGKEAISYGIGIIYQDEIDEINILQATKKGLHEAVKSMEIKPNIILVDALEGIDTLGIPYKSIIKGDAKSYSIGAASIIAKVTRDRIMREWDKIYPEYGFAGHKGYGTAKHIEAIKRYGLTPIHRKTFCKNFI